MGPLRNIRCEAQTRTAAPCNPDMIVQKLSQTVGDCPKWEKKQARYQSKESPHTHTRAHCDDLTIGLHFENIK